MALLRKNHRASTAFLPIFFAVATAAATTSLAQTPSEPLTLFEAIDSGEQNARQDAPLPRAGDGAGAEFSLMGVTRIGSKRTVLLQHISGETHSIALKGAASPIPKHDGFSVMLSDSGEIAVQYPPSRLCAPSPDQGVSCDAGNRAILTMATADPLPVPESLQAAEGSTEDGATWVGDDAEPGEPPMNPFEALRRRAERGERGDVLSAEEQATRFRPRRIDPSQIPEGKRVVSTPFGDRLVDI